MFSYLLVKQNRFDFGLRKVNTALKLIEGEIVGCSALEVFHCSFQSVNLTCFLHYCCLGVNSSIT